MGILSGTERLVLKTHIDELNNTIRVGFYPLNWTSQRIPAYIEELDHALVRFKSTVSQLHKNAAMIDDVVQNISNTLLIQARDFKSSNGILEPMDVSTFFDIMEAKRLSRLEALVQEYKSIGDSFLLKVEEVVAKTATGYSPVLASYYMFWEKKIYNAIAKMILSSMAVLMGMLQCKDSLPLLKLTVVLNGKDLSINPSLTDIDKFIAKGMRSIAESSKLFVRWMNGTCIRTEPQSVHEDDEPYVFSFYQDISLNPEIVKLTLSLTSQTNKVFNLTNKYLDGWRRYDKVSGLWNPKRKQQIEKLRPTCSNLDQAMGSFQAIKVTVDSQPTIKDIDFLQIDVAMVAVGVAKQAELWKSEYGEALHSNSAVVFNRLTSRLSKLEEDIALDTPTLEELKFVLNTIAEVTSLVQEVELEIEDITERYRTLKRYDIAIPEDELEAAMNIQKRWKTLYINARTRDLRLIDTKNKFRIVTAQQDIDFREELTKLRTQFLDCGPGVSSVSLEQGVELMAEYKTTLARLNKVKAELINAQNLFNLDVKGYPMLQMTMFDMDQLDKIYSLFIKFKDFQETMASTLWGDLDIQVLMKGADDFEKECKRFPKELKEIYTFKTVEARLANFKESLPLVVNLKNDAMKQRHWIKLMDVTKVTFDTTLKTLTLSNIFSMELHRFTADVEDIINEAGQEAKIENELAKIEAAWRNNSLSFYKYKKDGQERGYCLRPADDIKLELDDNLLNLQTISGSRFVGQFVDTVRKWEKTLNTVSECLEVWFVVQRKWMYLEGIFIGAEDIRMQLPEEAKKFDAIDKAFKIIMNGSVKNPNIVEACTTENRLATLNSLSDRLDMSQKS